MNWLLSLFQDRTFGVARSPKWREVRKEHLKIQDKCQACLKKKDLEVHHIIPVHKEKYLELNPDNLITLCSSCHILFGHLGSFLSHNIFVREDALVMRSKVLRRP